MGPSWKVRLATAALVRARPLLLAFSDRTWSRLLGVAAVLFPRARPALEEAADVVRGGPPGTTILRRMVAGTTESEVRDLLWGLVDFHEWGAD